ncbi:hypothetical protein [Glutamicibacter arilaitensis]|uniref:Alpha/beta hydrolase n=1 Tax=Glutamicibacter arilaitensis TaxID=256701 RepID=A0A4Y8U146_9MICC|nr:hypothetical protein [Glutamicibacter arilaitensis]TFH57414.1 hypothetical protein EXY26_10630 [Glutamicibacter arilaitensis]
MNKNYKQWNLEHYVWDDFEHLESLWNNQTGVHTVRFSDEESDIDFLYKDATKMEEIKVQPIFFTAALNRKPGMQGPFFTGNGLAKRAEIPLLAFADASLDEDPTLSLSWYRGANKSRFNRHLVQVIEFLCHRLEREPLFIGGSGGGFTALATANDYKSKSSALVWNPQTDIYNYNKKFVQNFLRSQYKLGNGSFHRPDWIDFCRIRTDKESDTTVVGNFNPTKTRRLIYLQNQNDWHFRSHLQPFWDSISTVPIRVGKNFLTDEHLCYVSDFAEGHSAPPEALIRRLIVSLMNPDQVVSSIEY